MSVPRSAAVLLALCLVAGSCSKKPAGSGVSPESPSATATTRGSATGASSPGRGLPGTPPAAASIPAASFADGGPLGTMARAFLRGSPARRLVVEVDWVAGLQPSDIALTHVRDVLQSVCDKPAGITVRRGAQVSESRSSWSIDDIKRVESSARAEHSSGDTATMWIAYLNGSLAGSPDALGVAFEASAVAIFRDRINDATTALLLASEIERSVVMHEVGHVLALVNIGYRSRIEHEDPDHPHHSKNKDSVMYWAIDDVSIASLLGGGPPDDFDDADRADLAMLKAS